MLPEPTHDEQVEASTSLHSWFRSHLMQVAGALTYDRSLGGDYHSHSAREQRDHARDTVSHEIHDLFNNGQDRTSDTTISSAGRIVMYMNVLHQHQTRTFIATESMQLLLVHICANAVVAVYGEILDIYKEYYNHRLFSDYVEKGNEVIDQYFTNESFPHLHQIVEHWIKIFTRMLAMYYGLAEPGWEATTSDEIDSYLTGGLRMMDRRQPPVLYSHHPHEGHEVLDSAAESPPHYYRSLTKAQLARHEVLLKGEHKEATYITFRAAKRYGM